MNEDFNMSMRKFLKQVGVTSQQAIEEALRDAEMANMKFRPKLALRLLAWFIK